MSKLRSYSKEFREYFEGPKELPLPVEVEKIGTYNYLPEDWDYYKSIHTMRENLLKWEKVTFDILLELWIANKKLSKRGRPKKIGTSGSIMTWNSYCKDIGISKRTANRWLQYFDPKLGKIKKPKAKEEDGIEIVKKRFKTRLKIPAQEAREMRERVKRLFKSGWTEKEIIESEIKLKFEEGAAARENPELMRQIELASEHRKESTEKVQLKVTLMLDKIYDLCKRYREYLNSNDIKHIESEFIIYNSLFP